MIITVAHPRALRSRTPPEGPAVLLAGCTGPDPSGSAAL